MQGKRPKFNLYQIAYENKTHFMKLNNYEILLKMNVPCCGIVHHTAANKYCKHWVENEAEW
jgi:hypothetical protein